MSIRVVCCNGHVLKVNDSFAGRSAACPACKAQVNIPAADPASMSEDAIMDILGPRQTASKPAGEASAKAAAEAAPVSAGKVPPPHMKICIKCNREMESTGRICPYCRTYVGGAGQRF
jgi:hypothetical protein